MPKIKWILFSLLFVILVYTRFVNLSWGLPHPMHPDERNMANAIQSLNCKVQSSKFKVQSCFNPHFFAYGQFPLYLGYGIVFLFKFFDGDLGTPISFEEAAMSLRVISAIASILNVLVLIKIVELLISNFQFSIYNKFSKLKILNLNENLKLKIVNLIVFTFSPFFIQFSHFGTTESILMFLYTIIVYLSLKYLKGDLRKRFYILTAIFSGLAIASKVSSVIFLVIPIVVLIDSIRHSGERSDSRIVVNNNDSAPYSAKTTKGKQAGMTYKLFLVIKLISLSLVFSILFSPHNFISFPEFLGSMKYESEVALGTYRAFYTRQFEGATPVLFQFVKIFPNTLGRPALILFLLGFIFLPFKKEFNLVRLAILLGFLSNTFWYAKWTRFLAPILPLMLVLAVVFLEFSIFNFQFLFKSKFLNFKFIKFIANFKLQITNYLRIIFIVIIIIPGIAYLSIYQNPDVRFTASEYIYKNIPRNSYILFETANVVDIPITNPKSEIRNPKQSQDSNYQMISFNFYDLDENPILQSELRQHLAKADYIFIPSRRIFANNTCFKPSSQSHSGLSGIVVNKTTILDALLQSSLTRMTKCSDLRKRYPLLNDYYDKLFSGELGFVKVAEFNAFPKIQLFGKTILEFPDEEAEETWTVFDHPVIRIYKKI